MTLLFAFGWAVAEATVWPFMPDAVLVPLALARPSSWWRLVLAAALGTTVGGAVSYVVGKRRPEHAAIARLPMVRPSMVSVADGWLAAGGPRAALRQPASGIPMKVFARLAGAQGLSLGRFLLWAVAARSARFTVAAGGAALLGRLLPADRKRWLPWLTLAWGVVFWVGLRQTVVYWERQAAHPSHQ